MPQNVRTPLLKYYGRLVLLLIWMMISSFIGILGTLVYFRKPKGLSIFPKLFGRGAMKIMGTELVFEGLENFDKVKDHPCIHVGNHQSGLDMATFGYRYPVNTTIVIKREVLYIPILGFFFYFGGALLVNRKKGSKAISQLLQVVPHIQDRGLSIAFFPEGTRNRSLRGIKPFKKGAFLLAIRAGVPILPWVSSSLYDVANPERKILGGGKITLRILPPVSTEGYKIEDAERLSEEVHALMLKAYNELSP